MKTIICFFLILTVSVATDVNIYVYSGYQYYVSQKTKPVPKDLFSFGYRAGDLLAMKIYLTSEDPNVTTDMYIESGVYIQKKVTPKLTAKGKQYFEIQRMLADSKIVIDLELNTTNGLCTRKQIVKGIKVSGFPDEATRTLYNDICLNTDWCVVDVQLLNNVNKETVSDIKTSNDALIITSSASGVAVFLLVFIIATWKRCWIKLQDTPRLQTNQNSFEPFYLNMLFRSECEREIAEIDSHVYAEIDPPIYEEINHSVTEGGCVQVPSHYCQ